MSEIPLDLAFGGTYDRWPLLLSVFWLLPGPSGLYAQLGMATLGTIGVVNVYLICEHYHSKQAGIIAVLPLSFFPSYVFMHSVVQREAVVLFAMTTAFVLIFSPNRHIYPPYNYLLASVMLLLPAYLRFPNAPVIIAVTVATLAVAFLNSDRISLQRKLQALGGTTFAGAATIYLTATRLITDDPVQYLADVRERRIRGRATYLEGVIPESLPELLVFSWVSAVYFLFAPFPWHVERIDDFVIMLESMIGLAYAVFAVLGALVLKEKSLPATVALVSGIVLFSVLYGFGTGNYGTGLRHRQVIFWAIFILGAIGFSSKVRFDI